MYIYFFIKQYYLNIILILFYPKFNQNLSWIPSMNNITDINFYCYINMSDLNILNANGAQFFHITQFYSNYLKKYKLYSHKIHIIYDK